MAGACLVTVTSPALPQTVPFCNLTEVKVQKLSNAIRLEFTADGILDVQADELVYFDPDKDWAPRTLDRIVLNLRNARSRVGNLINVNQYPVSHVLLRQKPEAVEGVGLIVEVPLYAQGKTAGFFEWDVGRRQGQRGSARNGVTFHFFLSPNKRTLILLITSDRRVVTEEVRRPPLTDADRQEYLHVIRHLEGVEIHALNADLHEVLRRVGEATGAALYAPANITRRVTASFRTPTVESLLQALADCLGLLVRQGPEGYSISEGGLTETKLYTTEVERIPLKYLQPQRTPQLLPDFLLSHISPEVEGNALVAHGSPALLAKLRSDIERLDQPPTLIEVELLAVETLDRRELTRGLSLTWQRPDGAATFDSQDSVLSLEKVGALPHEFSARLAGQIERQRARLWSQSKLRVLSGNEAQLFAGRRRFITVIRPAWQPFADLQPVEVGARLRVTPWTGDDKTLVTKVTAEISQLVEGGEGASLATVARRELTSTLRTVSGETLMIGGLRLRQNTLRRGRYPVLSVLPLAGPWLSSKKKLTESTELVFFLTPRIVQTSQVNEEALQELRKWSDNETKD